MSGKCIDCVWAMENENAQRICDICPNDSGSSSSGSSSGGGSRAGVKRKYISVEAFNKKAKLVEWKWSELNTEDVYYVKAVHERTVKDQISKYAELHNIVSGERITAWLTPLIVKELEACNFVKTSTYIQSLGVKENKEGTREYYDFVIIHDEIDNQRLTLEQFKVKAKLKRNILKWRELSIGETYYINALVERQTSKYAELEDIKDGARKNVWLPKLITSVLEKYDLAIPTYIRPMGLKQTIDGARSYHDFLIVTDDDDDEVFMEENN